MRSFPIIPIWLMLIISLGLITYIFIFNKKSLTQIIIVILIFTINLRFMIPSEKSKVVANNLDVLFVIDTTLSMGAEDYNGTNTRISGVKKDCEFIIKRLHGAKYSIITFNNKSRIVIPYTKDTNLAIESLEIIKPIQELYAKGSSLNTPIETIVKQLKSSKKYEDRIRVIFFISDGEITDDSRLNSYREISKLVDSGAVLGYGTTQGGYMLKNNNYDEQEKYVVEHSIGGTKRALSKIDERNLRKIASDMGVNYINMSKQSNLNSQLKVLDNLIVNGIQTSDKSTYGDTYYFLVIPLLLLLMIEFNKIRRSSI